QRQLHPPLTAAPLHLLRRRFPPPLAVVFLHRLDQPEAHPYRPFGADHRLAPALQLLPQPRHLRARAVGTGQRGQPPLTSRPRPLRERLIQRLTHQRVGEHPQRLPQHLRGRPLHLRGTARGRHRRRQLPEVRRVSACHHRLPHRPPHPSPARRPPSPPCRVPVLGPLCRVPVPGPPCRVSALGPPCRVPGPLFRVPVRGARGRLFRHDLRNHPAASYEIAGEVGDGGPVTDGGAAVIGAHHLQRGGDGGHHGRHPPGPQPRPGSGRRPARL